MGLFGSASLGMVCGLRTAAPGALRVSTLTACWNASRWLPDCVDSLRAQTVRDIEIILVDDGSTDSTWSIIEHYSRIDHRVVPLRLEHQGLARALNTGLDLARAEWIARLDGDDVAEPSRVEQQLAYARRNPDVVVVGSGFLEIAESGAAVRQHAYPPEHGALIRRLSRLRGFFPHSSAMFRRLSGLRHMYNPRFEKSQDADLWLRIGEHHRIACLPQALVRIRRHEEQVSRSVTGTRQIVYGVAACACHHLRIAGHEDPSAASEGERWSGFLRFVEKRVFDDGMIERLMLRGDAGSATGSGGRRARGFVRLTRQILGSGQVLALVLEKLLGSSLPQRIAREWVKRSCVA